ncbi:hypothetical protein RYX36_024940, partial [Vicia faba]
HPKPDPELVQFTGGSASIVQSHILGLQDQNRDNNAEENLTEDEEDEEIDMMHVDHDPMDNEVSARKGAEFRERLMNEVNRPYCEEECNRLDLAKQIDAAGDNLPKRGFFFWLTSLLSVSESSVIPFAAPLPSAGALELLFSETLPLSYSLQASYTCFQNKNKKS